jgi:8-oxo-dGTP diphosphatase
MSKDLLLQDYRYRSESLWKSEQAGETRVQLFIGFATAVGAGLGLAVKENVATGERLRLVLLGWLLALLVIGLVTLARMIIRNEHTDKCKKGLDAIRQAFRDMDKEGVLLHYYPIEPPVFDDKKPTKDNWWRKYKKAVQPRKFGGLAHTVAATNALIFGAATAVAVIPASGLGTTPFHAAGSSWESGVVGLVAAIIAFAAQLFYVARSEASAKAKLKRGYHTHAGGVVFKKTGDKVEYLLVSATANSDELVLPKGHIEDNEGHAEAALREVREETGVVARPLGLIAANLEFCVDGKQIRAKFYLMETLFVVPPKEPRIPRWLTYADAMKELEFPESKYALEQAEARREALTRRDGAAISPALP